MFAGVNVFVFAFSNTNTCLFSRCTFRKPFFLTIQIFNFSFLLCDFFFGCLPQGIICLSVCKNVLNGLRTGCDPFARDKKWDEVWGSLVRRFTRELAKSKTVLEQTPSIIVEFLKLNRTIIIRNSASRMSFLPYTLSEHVSNILHKVNKVVKPRSCMLSRSIKKIQF